MPVAKLIGFVVIAFLGVLPFWHKWKHPLGVNRCVYDEKAKKDSPRAPHSLLGIQQRRDSPSNNQYDETKGYILPFVSMFVIFPIFIGAFVLYLTLMQKMFFANISAAESKAMAMGGAFVLGSLFVVSVNTLCIVSHKRLPRYAAKGIITQKKIVNASSTLGYHSSANNGYIWKSRPLLPKRYCSMTISGVDYYVPQKIYDELQENECVEVVYNELFYALVVLSFAHIEAAEVPTAPTTPIKRVVVYSPGASLRILLFLRFFLYAVGAGLITLFFALPLNLVPAILSSLAVAAFFGGLSILPQLAANREKRLQLYATAIISGRVTPLADIAKALNKSVEFVKKDLQKAIEARWVRNAYIDLKTDSAMLLNESRKYTEHDK